MGSFQKRPFLDNTYHVLSGVERPYENVKLDMIYTVVEDWVATYSNPIHLTSKEHLELTGRQDNRDGHIWLWAKSTIGLEGWIPDSLVEEVDGIQRANEDYTGFCRKDFGFDVCAV